MTHGSAVRRIVTVMLLVVPVTAPQAALVQFLVPLSGSEEFPGPGDPDGSGLADLTIDSVTNTISWNITVNNIALPLSGAHIHQAPAGVAGPIVVDFSAQLSGSGLVDADLANVLANPTGFYVNLHNSPDFPAGAIRGQLSAPVPLPSAVWLFGGGLLSLIGAARRKAASADE